MALMPFPKKAARNLGVVALCLVIGTYGPREALRISTAEALMLVSPFMLAGWVYAQNIGRGGRTALGGRIREIATGPLPRMTHSAYMLGVAGFIGSAAAELAPVDAIAGHLSHEHIRPWIFLTALPIIVMVAGNIAVAPVMMVVFLAAVISALPVLPADPDLIALSLGAGWALSMTAAPNATGPILLAGVTGLPATTLTWRWNGIYSLAALAALGAVFFVIA